MHALCIEKLAVSQVRNLVDGEFRFGDRFNVFGGDNGQGKTNLLEAIYVLATSKSFRTSKILEIGAHGRDATAVRITGELREDGFSRAQSIVVARGKRDVRIDGKRPNTLLTYAVRTPIVVFHPQELALGMGPDSERRRLLDRIALFLRPAAAHAYEAQSRALKERQAALVQRGTAGSDLESWEALAVEHGRAVVVARQAAAEALGEAAADTFREIGTPGLTFSLHYAPNSPTTDDAWRSKLAERRTLDLHRGAPTVGPHRDGVTFALDGVGMRGVASQGQHRAAVLAMKSAEIAVLQRARGVRPILLLDDVSSELDEKRTAALFDFLRAQEGQVFLTTTRPDLLPMDRSARTDFSVRNGQVLLASGNSS